VRGADHSGRIFGAGDLGRVKRTYAGGGQALPRLVNRLAITAALLRSAHAGGRCDAEGITLTLIYRFCGPLSLAPFFFQKKPRGRVVRVESAFQQYGATPIIRRFTKLGRNTLRE